MDDHDKLDLLITEVREIRRLLVGDPNDKPGLVIRLDRVIERVGLHNWLIFLLISSAIAAFFK